MKKEKGEKREKGKHLYSSKKVEGVNCWPGDRTAPTPLGMWPRQQSSHLQYTPTTNNSGNFLLEGTPFSDFLLETFYLILSGILTFGIVQILASKSSQKPISINFSTAVSVPNHVIQRILSWMRFNEITVLHGVKIRESWRAYVLKGFQNPTRGISPRRYLKATGNPATR